MAANPEFDESMYVNALGAPTLWLQTRYPVVAASRLRLRPFTLFDIPRLVSVVCAQRIADATLAVPQLFDGRRARQWIESHPSDWRKRCAVHWAVSGQDSDRLSGYVGVHDIQLQRGRAELSFWIAERIARKDLTIEAAQAALAFAFTSLQLDTVCALQLSGKPFTARILRRLGMKLESATAQSVWRWDRSEEVFSWSVSRATWMMALRDGAAP